METVHDAWALVPAFSSLDRFLEITAGLDGAEHAEWPSIDEDGDAPHACYQAARAALKEQAFEAASSLLLRAIERLPEYTAALSLLSTQYLRQSNHADACRIAIRAIRSPPSLGHGAELGKIWSWLSRQSKGPDDIAADPIWIRRAALGSPPPGGAKENPTYPVLMESIEAYVADGKVVAALTLMQTYAEFMSRETVSFHERYGFMFAAHRDRQLALEARLPTGPRALD